MPPAPKALPGNITRPDLSTTMPVVSAACSWAGMTSWPFCMTFTVSTNFTATMLGDFVSIRRL